jgi:hypothetical protein
VEKIGTLTSKVIASDQSVYQSDSERPNILLYSHPNEILKWRMESSLKTQGFIEACMKGEQATMSPLPADNPPHGQHREGRRLKS